MSYAGDLTVVECWELLKNDNNAFLIDVRTTAEWAYVGLPLLGVGMRDIILLQWQTFPEMSVNSQFSTLLRQELDRMGATPEAKLCFLCRSGVRSLAAAKVMTAQGYRNSYNISSGFEGDLDEMGHRGGRNGWKAHGLAWQQR